MIGIDVSQIPPDKLNRSDFLSLKTGMDAALLQQNWRKAFCIHEAGHMIYFKRAGIVEFTFHGPRIVYNEVKDQFDGYMASVTPMAGSPPQDVERIPQFLNDVAKAFVAGRTFTRRLTNAPDTGEVEDRENFEALCAQIENSSGRTIDRKKSWEDAEQAVLIDLRRPEFRVEAWETAKQIEGNLFGS